MPLEMLLTAFLIGLLGSGHCVGMCGGFTSFVALQLNDKQKQRQYGSLLLFNLGRITTYCLLALVFSYFASLAFSVIDVSIASKLQIYFSSIMFILLGLYVSRWWKGLALLEKAGFYLHQKLKPFTNKLRPTQSLWHLYLYGLTWGLFPCGMVYTALLIAVAYSSVLNAVAYMFLFGMGTLPLMMLAPYLLVRVNKIFNNNAVRSIFGLFFIALGVLLFFLGGELHHHS